MGYGKIEPVDSVELDKQAMLSMADLPSQRRPLW